MGEHEETGVIETGEGVPRSPRRLTTILAADLCDYTALSESDPARALAGVEAMTGRIDAVARAHGGRLFHRAGDGFLAELPSASAGVAAALAIQDRPADADGHPLCLRVGVHTGEVTEEASGDLLGHAVNVAARLQGAAPKRGTVISNATRTLSETGAPLRRMGDLKLKGLREPVTAYEVLTRGPVLAEVRAFLRFKWLARNLGPALVVGLTVLLAGGLLIATLVGRDLDLAAQRVAAADAARLKDDAAALADLLTEEEARLLDRAAVEKAALGLLGSTDEGRAEARRLALAGDTLGAAWSLRAAYEERANAAPPAELAEIAAQCGALAYERDRALAQWAYERAYEAMPREPFVLLRLARIAVDRNRLEDARSYLSALLALRPGPRYVLEANKTLGFLSLAANEFDEAETRYRRALATARLTDDVLAEAWVLIDLGTLDTHRAVATGDAATRASFFAAGEQRLKRASRIFLAANDVKGTLGVQTALGSTYQQQRRHAEAAEAYERVFEIVQQGGDAASLSSLAFNLSTTYDGMGRVPDRDAYLDIAFDAARAGSVESMLPVLHAMRASYAHRDGDDGSACRDRAEAYDHGSQNDVDLILASTAPTLTCPDGLVLEPSSTR